MLIESSAAIYGAYQLANEAERTVKILGSAYNNRQKKRLEEFVKYVEIRYEYMTSCDQEKLKVFIENEKSEDVLADYAESILKVSSSRVMMAMALLFLGDLALNKTSKYNFISASKELNDDLVDFYILVHQKEKHRHDNLPYEQATFSNDNCQEFLDKGWDKETISIYIYRLIQLKLLLPDPLPISGYTTKSNVWRLNFGVSNNTQAIVNLLVKSGELLRGFNA